MSDNTNNKKLIFGLVVSVAMKDALVVEIERTKSHPIYGKRYKVNSRIKAKNSLPEIKIGDKVGISSIRPASREIHYQVEKVVK